MKSRANLVRSISFPSLLVLIALVCFLCLSNVPTSYSHEHDHGQQKPLSTCPTDSPLTSEACKPAVADHGELSVWQKLVQNDYVSSLLEGWTTLDIVPVEKEWEVWFRSFRATTVITLLGNACLIFFLYFDISPTVLNQLISFAVGGLLGDVFIHILPHTLSMPHAYESVDGHSDSGSQKDIEADASGHSHSYGVGLCVLGGILCFFFIERMLRIISPMQAHSHSHAGALVSSKPGHQTSDTEDNVRLVEYLLRPGVILNLVADAVHNFTDGLAIATAYQLESQTQHHGHSHSHNHAPTASGMGVTMTLAVLLHEIPHELGDFAVLLSNGLPKHTAFGLQFVSAIGAYLGCLTGLILSSEGQEGGDGLHGMSSLILGFTGGGFIYVSLANLVPDLLGKEVTLIELLGQVVMFSLGVGAMVVVAELEHSQSHTH